MMAMRALRDGNACLHLEEYGGRPFSLLVGKEGEFIQDLTLRNMRLPTPAEWRKELKACREIVGTPGEEKPLILDDDRERLYLRRYWEYETELAAGISRRAAMCFDIDRDALFDKLEILFPAQADSEADRQKAAAATAALKALCIISGGPGTGKTSTVIKILLLLQQLHLTKPLRIGLAAPTGKAAGRLQDSIQKIGASLAIPDEIKRFIPREVRTIHRLLGYRPHSPYFNHGRHHPLNLDVLVVDEASMVDLALMSKVCGAFPEQGRLILLGDKDQLASVEPGRVLGDICGVKKTDALPRTFLSRDRVKDDPESFSPPSSECSPLTDSIVLLTKSYRFSGKGGIGRLAKAVNTGNMEETMRLLTDTTLPEIQWINWPESDNPYLSVEGFPPLFRERIIAGYADIARVSSPEEAFRLYNRFRILCAHKEGPFGVKSINRLVQVILAEEHIISMDKSPWYHGRPILITRNTYSLQLYNGDTGIILEDSSRKPQAYFPDAEKKFRAISPARIDHCETAFAMTVHKSQGDEFDHVVLILPPIESKIVSRELLYTAITRARKSFMVMGTDPVLRSATANQIYRHGGLAEKLHCISV